MKYFLTILTFFLALTSCKSEAEKITERNAVVDSTIAGFQKVYYQNQLDSIISEAKFNGTVSVEQNGEKIFEKENGLENFQQKAKLDSNSVFAIGSVSKQFTAVLVLLQEESGKLKTSDLVSNYLEEFQNSTYRNITVEQLLNHSSGIDDFGPGLKSESGTDFNYSNKGYRFLGKLVEKVSGKSFDQNAGELFAKAGMENSATPGSFKENKDFASANVGSEKQNQLVENMPQRLSKDEISTPAGGFLSTVNDLHRWNNALFSGKILKPESLKKMTTKYSNRPHYVLGNVGYGYGIMMNLGKPEAYFHSGYVKGSPSLLVYYPGTKTSVVILSNIADESKGKEAFFQPHAFIKRSADAVENTVLQLKSEMLKPIEN